MLNALKRAASSLSSSAKEAVEGAVNGDVSGQKAYAYAMASMVMADGIVETSEIEGVAGYLGNDIDLIKSGQTSAVIDYFNEKIADYKTAKGNKLEVVKIRNATMAEIAKASCDQVWKDKIIKVLNDVAPSKNLDQSEKEVKDIILQVLA